MIRGRKSKRSGQMGPFDSPYTDEGGGEVPFFSFPFLFLDFILFFFSCSLHYFPLKGRLYESSIKASPSILVLDVIVQ